MEDQNADVLGRLAAALELLAVRDPRPRVKLTPPTFDGSGDVELFIRQFSDVAEANEWTADISLRQLRNSLKDKAVDCGRAVDYRAVLEALRMRFGTSASEAQALLANVRRDHRTSLQEYASYVNRLVNLANPELPEQYRRNRTLRTFKSTLGHVGLQWHLLVANVQTLEEAVQVGSEYLQIGSQATSRQESGVAQCDFDDQESDQVKSSDTDTNRQMLDTLAELSTRLDQLETSLKQQQKKEKKPPVCYECQEPGHLRASCPLKKQGNGQGPRS